MDSPSPSFLFHRHAFIFRNAETTAIPFDGPSAKIYFSNIGDSLISLNKAPFGSFILGPAVTRSDLISLVEKIQEWAIANDIINLTIRSFPDIYSPNHSSLIQNVLLVTGFYVKYEDITQVLHVSAGEMDLDTHKKRRIRKAKSLRYSFRQVTLDFLEEGYSLIVESRKNKDYPVTMTMKELKDMFILFPEEYLLFGVFDKTKMIAASVSIKINSEILYAFYIGDSIAYRSASPVTVLINGIHDFCGAHGIHLLDLGLSTDRGVLNKGLYEFKKSFGSFDSHKLTFEKLL